MKQLKHIIRCDKAKSSGHEDNNDDDNDNNGDSIDDGSGGGGSGSIKTGKNLEELKVK